MKHLLSIIVCLTALAASSASSDYFTVDGIRYYKLSNSTLQVYGASGFSGALEINAVLSYEGVDYKVVSIRRNAFSGNKNITEVTFNVLNFEIGYEAFSGCTGIKKVHFPTASWWPNATDTITIGNGAFYGCTALEEINIYANTRVKSRAFMGCTSVDWLMMENCVVEKQAFTQCTALETVHIGSKVFFDVDMNEQYDFFSNCPNIYAYYVEDGNPYYSAYENVLFNADRTILYRYPNKRSSGGNTAKTYIVPRSVKYIAGNAFYCNDGLETITARDGLEEIGASAFAITKLTSISLPNTLHHIGKHAFYNAESLTEIQLPESLETIGDGGFRGSGLVDVVLPDNLEEVGADVFSYCESLNHVILGKSMKSVSKKMFYFSKIKSIQIPEGVTKICESAFDWCYYITSITLPASVNRIESKALAAPKLTEIHVRANQPISIPASTFDGVDRAACTLYVPVGSYQSYYDAIYWNDFLNIVEETSANSSDVTGDGSVDIADVNLCINMMLGKADQTAAADVSGDGAVDIADINAIINTMLGK